MNKVAFIYKVPENDNYLGYLDETSYFSGCEGIENWLLSLSREFAGRDDFEVTVFCKCRERHISKDNVEFIPVGDFKDELTARTFDNIIITRDLYDIIEILKNDDFSGNVFCQAHDIIMKHFGGELSFRCSKDMQYENIRKYIVLSDFHRRMLVSRQNIPEDKIVKIGNGINPDEFEGFERDHVIDHGILWTSAFNRSPEILTDYVLPEVRKEIPDFYVEMSAYLGSGSIKNFEGKPGINILGKIDRKTLIDKMGNHACWFNPGTFPENFCIFMVEAAMCSCDIIMDLRNFGPADIMHPFVDTISLKKSEYSKSFDMFNDSIHEISGRIINSIEDYHAEDSIALRNNIRKYILKNFTWSKIADDWIKLFKEFE